MRDHEVDPETQEIYRAGLWWTIAYLLVVIGFLALSWIYAFTRPSGFAESLAGILAPVATVWGAFTIKSRI